MFENYLNQKVNNICNLPIEILEQIISYLSYDDIARIRAVCRLFDCCSQSLLNRGFVKVEKYHANYFKEVKAKLPRRESERIEHPLALHHGVLSSIETRLTLLGMTYMEYVEKNVCCFIPGKVIDEIYRVLRFMQKNTKIPRKHEIIKELRDISSMAMEYFEDKIKPHLENKLAASTYSLADNSIYFSSSPIDESLSSTCRCCQRCGSPMFADFQKINSYSESEIKTNLFLKQIRTSQNNFMKELNQFKIESKKISSLKREIYSLRTRNANYEKIMLEKNDSISELKKGIEDLRRRINKFDRKRGLNIIKDKKYLWDDSKS